MENSERCREQKTAYDSWKWPVSGQAKSAAFVAANEPSKADEEKQPRKDSEDGGEDRVIARQSARAAERQADYAEISLWVSGLAAVATAWAAIEAGRAATAAAASNKIAHDNAKRELRAYVFATRAVLEFTSTGVKATIRVENSGQTPAKNYESFAGIFVSIIPFEPSYIREPAQKLGRFTSSLPPNGNVGIIVEDKKVRSDWFEQAKSGVLPTFVHGMIWYEDVFDESHVTKFRFVWRGSETDPPGVMMTAEAGNEAT